MFCIKCGKKLQPEANFCGNCGHEIDKMASEPVDFPRPLPEGVLDYIAVSWEGEKDLRDCDLRGANLYGADPTGAKYSANTKWPEGFDPVAAGAVLVEDDD